MGKNVKLTDEAYLDVKELAMKDGLSVAGEIRKMVELRKIIDTVAVLEEAAKRLKAQIEE